MIIWLTILTTVLGLFIFMEINIFAKSKTKVNQLMSEYRRYKNKVNTLETIVYKYYNKD